MLFIVHCIDRAGVKEIRNSKYESHVSHLSNASEYGVKLVMAGPLVDEINEESVLGSCLLMEAKSKKQVERFNKEDPFNKWGVWEKVSIYHYKAKTF